MRATWILVTVNSNEWLIRNENVVYVGPWLVDVCASIVAIDDQR